MVGTLPDLTTMLQQAEYEGVHAGEDLSSESLMLVDPLV